MDPHPDPPAPAPGLPGALARPPLAEVLIVEDEPKIAAVIADYLQAAGYATRQAADGLAALAAFDEAPADVVLLDLMLPRLDGLEVCRALRRSRRPAVGIIMVTARVDEVERLLGLEVGADDYLCKPFSPRELVARVRALLRRAQGRLEAVAAASALGTNPATGSIMNAAMNPAAPPTGLHLDEAAQRALWRGQPLPLTPVEWRLLRALAQAEGRVLSRARLLDAIHDDYRDVSDRAVDSHVKNLRRKLAAALPPGHEAIESIYGMGYRFDRPPAD